MRTRFLSWCNRFNRWFTIKPRLRGKLPARARRDRTCLSLETLEDRTVPATFVVNTVADIPIFGIGAAPGDVNPANGAIVGVGTGHTVTLRSAIEASNNAPGSNTIKLNVSGTYKITVAGAPGEADNLAGEFAILPGANLTILNTSGGKAVVDANHQNNRVFDINPTDDTTVGDTFTVSMKGFTITHGVAGPGDGPGDIGSGGGILDEGIANLTLTNMTITNNTATADGGGVSMENTTDVFFTLIITNSVISDNHAGDAGGGVETDDAGTVIITGGKIVGNSCLNQGAGIWLDTNGADSANMNVIGTLISDNTAQNMLGGGIGNAGNGAVSITSCTIEFNSSGGAGAGFADAAATDTLIVSNSLFFDNKAVGNGGGIEEMGISTSITDTEIRGNSSGAAGGGIFDNGVTLTVQRCTIAHNTSGGDGGGIELETTGLGIAGSLISASTITGNKAVNNAGANGGGIDAPAGFTGDVTVVNVTINDNVADNGGGIFYFGGGNSFTIQNTIVAQNTATTLGPDIDDNGTANAFTDNGGNVIGVGDNGITTPFTATGDQTGTLADPLDPLLAPLGNYGGPSIGSPGFKVVLQTEPLRTHSPAINDGIVNGTTPALDERGVLFVHTVNHTLVVNSGAVRLIV